MTHEQSEKLLDEVYSIRRNEITTEADDRILDILEDVIKAVRNDTNIEGVSK